MSHLPKSYIDNLTSILRGDLSGGLPTGIVSKINGTSVPTTGSSDIGKYLNVTGSGVAAWQQTVLHGDLSGSLPTGTVEKINGTTVPTTSGGDAGKVLTVTGAGAATWQSSVVAAGIVLLPVIDVENTSNITISGTARTTSNGVALNTVGMRVFLNNQNVASQSGLWIVQTGAWTRATDMPSGAHFASSIVIVNTGTATFFAGTVWATVTANYPDDLVDTNGWGLVQISNPNGRYVAASSIVTLSSGQATVSVSSFIGNFVFAGTDRVIVSRCDPAGSAFGQLAASNVDFSGANFTIKSYRDTAGTIETGDHSTVMWEVNRLFGVR